MSVRAFKRVFQCDEKWLQCKIKWTEVSILKLRKQSCLKKHLKFCLKIRLLRWLNLITNEVRFVDPAVCEYNLQIFSALYINSHRRF